MNCLTIAESTAWPCAPVHGHDDAYMVTPPVQFWDGSIVPLYVFGHGSQVHITDDGGLLQHLEVSGFELSQQPRRRTGLRRAVEEAGVTFSDELAVVCPADRLSHGLQKALAGLYAARFWEHEHAGRPVDSGELMAEAEQYLRIIKSAAVFRKDVALRGITGRTLVFPLGVDEALYDAMSTHPVSSAAMTKKLFDARSVRDQADTDIRLVVDDRGDMERVKQDMSLLSQLAHVERMTALRSEALALT